MTANPSGTRMMTQREAPEVPRDPARPATKVARMIPSTWKLPRGPTSPTTASSRRRWSASLTMTLKDRGDSEGESKGGHGHYPDRDSTTRQSTLRVTEPLRLFPACLLQLFICVILFTTPRLFDRKLYLWYFRLVLLPPFLIEIEYSRIPVVLSFC